MKWYQTLLIGHEFLVSNSVEGAELIEGIGIGGPNE